MITIETLNGYQKTTKYSCSQNKSGMYFSNTWYGTIQKLDYAFTSLSYLTTIDNNNDFIDK